MSATDNMYNSKDKETSLQKTASGLLIDFMEFRNT